MSPTVASCQGIYCKEEISWPLMGKSLMACRCGDMYLRSSIFVRGLSPSYQCELPPPRQPAALLIRPLLTPASVQFGSSWQGAPWFFFWLCSMKRRFWLSGEVNFSGKNPIRPPMAVMVTATSFPLSMHCVQVDPQRTGRAVTKEGA